MIYSANTSNCFIIYLLSCFVFVSCDESDSLIIIKDGNIQDVYLVDTSDADVVPIKSAEPMKSIAFIDYYGNNIFMLSSDRKTLYYAQNDTVISKLEKTGRGPGEYRGVDLFTYSDNDSILYIYTSDMRILKYKVPDFLFIESISNIPTLQSIQVVDGSNLFVSYSYLDGRDAGLAIMSSETGEIIKKLCYFDEYVNMYFSNQKNFYKHSEKIFFPIVGYNSFSINRFDKGRIDTIKTFSYEKKWKTPKRIKVDDYSDINQLLTYNDYILKEKRCMGGYYPLIHGDSISFWSLYINKGAVYDVILNKYDGKEMHRSRIYIKGLLDPFRPSCIINNRYAVLLQTTKEDIINNEEQLSPLGKKIIDTVGNQDGNPILLLL